MLSFASYRCVDCPRVRMHMPVNWKIFYWTPNMHAHPRRSTQKKKQMTTRLKAWLSTIMHKMCILLTLNSLIDSLMLAMGAWIFTPHSSSLGKPHACNPSCYTSMLPRPTACFQKSLGEHYFPPELRARPESQIERWTVKMRALNWPPTLTHTLDWPNPRSGAPMNAGELHDLGEGVSTDGRSDFGALVSTLIPRPQNCLGDAM